MFVWMDGFTLVIRSVFTSDILSKAQAWCCLEVVRLSDLEPTEKPSYYWRHDLGKDGGILALSHSSLSLASL